MKTINAVAIAVIAVGGAMLLAEPVGAPPQAPIQAGGTGACLNFNGGGGDEWHWFTDPASNTECRQCDYEGCHTDDIDYLCGDRHDAC
jgi:hypothetical protein